MYNEKKKKVEPNHSFDLCRLSCSLIDYFVDDISEIDDICKKDPIIAMILGWCYDDKGRNILYKKNNVERYPEFKLYKMINKYVLIFLLAIIIFFKLRLSSMILNNTEHRT